ncbi:hypothetical protein Dimus_024171 [Dionaea muscipula]
MSSYLCSFYCFHGTTSLQCAWRERVKKRKNLEDGNNSAGLHISSMTGFVLPPFELMNTRLSALMRKVHQWVYSFITSSGFKHRQMYTWSGLDSLFLLRVEGNVYSTSETVLLGDLNSESLCPQLTSIKRVAEAVSYISTQNGVAVDSQWMFHIYIEGNYPKKENKMQTSST